MNGKPVKKNYKLVGGESLTVTMPELREVNITAEDIPLDIVYEDADIVVVNKPRGMVVHPAAGNWTGTLVNADVSLRRQLVGYQRRASSGYRASN